MDRRYVFLDPDGTQGNDWLYVVVRAPTGIFYEQQYGGTANLLAQVEGYLVPVADNGALTALEKLFVQTLRGSGAAGLTWPDDLLKHLRSAVEMISFWSSAHTAEGLNFSEPHPLELDEARLHEADEAWLPVITTDGPGVLVWANSD